MVGLPRGSCARAWASPRGRSRKPTSSLNFAALAAAFVNFAALAAAFVYFAALAVPAAAWFFGAAFAVLPSSSRTVDPHTIANDQHRNVNMKMENNH